MNQCQIPVHIHRFHEHVTISIGKGPTYYLTMADANKLSATLETCIQDLEKYPKFTQSQFTGRSYLFEGKGP